MVVYMTKYVMNVGAKKANETADLTSTQNDFKEENLN